MLLPLLLCYLCCLLLWCLYLVVASLVFVWSLVSLVLLRFFYDVGVVATGVAAASVAIGVAAAGVAIGVATTVVVATAVSTGVVTGIIAGVVTTGVAAASLVFLGLMSLLYACYLVYLR